jgi:hypothetical protein
LSSELLLGDEPADEVESPSNESTISYAIRWGHCLHHQ